MKKNRKKNRKTSKPNRALLTAAIAGMLAIALLIAGTMLRMRTHDLRFGEAFVSFVSDTFRVEK